MKYTTHSIDETYQIAEKIAEEFKDSGGLIALSGDLGAGKTTFTQGFAKALKIPDKILSPTFVLIRQHQIPETNRTLFHADLYRLEGEINPQDLGLKELWEDKNNIVLIEWSEKIKDHLPPYTVLIDIRKVSEDSREIVISSL